MVYGIIIEKGEKYHTYLKKILLAMEGLQTSYNWLLSNYDCFPSNKKIEERLLNEYCILSGTELTEMIEIEDFQWIWGTFSAFDKNVSEEQILNCPLPENDNYKGFWGNPLTIQHPLAKIEIVAFDSCLTLIYCKNMNLLEQIKKFFPYAKDLNEYNSSNFFE